MSSNKEVVSSIQSFFKTKGYDVKTSHIYDALSKAAGFQNWHVAKTKDVEFSKVIKQFDIKTNEKLFQYITSQLVDQNKKPIDFELDSPKLSAWNHLICAQTGSGKSVLVNSLLMNHLKKKPDSLIYILEEETFGGYSNFINLVGGEIVNLSKKLPHFQILELDPELSSPTPDKIESIAQFILADKKKEDSNFQMTKAELEIKVREFYQLLLCLQGRVFEKEFKRRFFTIFDFEAKSTYQKEFKLIPGTCEPSPGHFNFIMAILEVILSSNLNVVDGFKMFDYDEISELVIETYRQTKGRFPYLSDLLRVVDSIPQAYHDGSRQLIERFKIKLRNWTKDGPCPMFDSDTNIKVNNNVLLFQLNGLDAHPQLKKVYSLIVHKIVANLYNKKGSKIIVRDSLNYENNFSLDFLLEDLRTSRKNGLVTLTCVNSLSEFGDKKDVILNNVTSCLIGKITNHDEARLFKLFGVSDSYRKHLEQGSSISYENKQASFVLLNQNEQQKVYLPLTKVEFNLYSTTERDNVIVEYYLKEKRFDNLLDILLFISEDKHKEDVGLINYLKKNGFHKL